MVGAVRAIRAKEGSRRRDRDTPDEGRAGVERPGLETRAERNLEMIGGGRALFSVRLEAQP